MVLSRQHGLAGQQLGKNQGDRQSQKASQEPQRHCQRVNAPLDIGGLLCLARIELRMTSGETPQPGFEGGSVGTLASTGGIPASQRAHQQLELRIYGSRGYALLDAMAGTCSIFCDDGSIERFDDTPPELRYPLEATSRHLVDLILDKSASNVSSGEIGARTVELLDAAYRSAAEGRIVSVNEES